MTNADEHQDLAWERGWRHEFLFSAQSLAETLADIEGRYEDSELGLGVQVETVEIGLPIELDPWVDEGGAVVLATGTASQDLDSGFFPVLHQLRVTFAVEEADDGE